MWRLRKNKMKKLLLMATMLLMFGAANAQISELRKTSSGAELYHIYDDNGNKTNYYVSLSYGQGLMGHNSKYIIIRDNSIYKIFDSKGQNTGKYVGLSYGEEFIKISESSIMIKSNGMTKHYDFTGKYLRSN